MNPIVVQKYGGSSLADLERIRAVATRIVETVRSGKRVVAVVSAMGGTTDELLERAKKISEDPNTRELDAYSHEYRNKADTTAKKDWQTALDLFATANF